MHKHKARRFPKRRQEKTKGAMNMQETTITKTHLVIIPCALRAAYGGLAMFLFGCKLSRSLPMPQPALNVTSTGALESQPSYSA
ncbi:hypothetical protein SAMN05519103_09331 [Rhizobiales bacterium GAS113]|nr:hypothetical protein SAMN05519103_09331 [Rhizobiales bacterium GAS113]